MKTNSLKAEKILKFGEKEYKARIVLDTVKRIEEHFEKSIFKIGTLLTTGDMMTKDVEMFLTIVIRAGGNDINQSDIERHINNNDINLVDAMKYVGEMLGLALSTDSNNTEKKSNP